VRFLTALLRRSWNIRPEYFVGTSHSVHSFSDPSAPHSGQTIFPKPAATLAVAHDLRNSRIGSPSYWKINSTIRAVPFSSGTQQARIHFVGEGSFVPAAQPDNIHYLTRRLFA